MREDQSFGIIPLQKQQNEWMVFLVQLHAGHWGFPKGHAENEETNLQAASREFFEETGLQVEKILSETPLQEVYFFTHQGQKIKKTVNYFLALVTGKVSLQKLEIADGGWFTLGDAYDRISFPQGKKLCHKVEELLKKH